MAHEVLARQGKPEAAIIWEGEPGEKRTITYLQLHREVCVFANVLKRRGVKKGDRVLIYMPMIPEAAVAMLDPDTEAKIAQPAILVCNNPPGSRATSFSRPP